MPEIGNTVPPTVTTARRASEPPMLRSEGGTGRAFGRTVSRDPIPPERLSASVRVLHAQGPGRNAGVDSIPRGSAGSDEMHVYEDVDAIVDPARRAPLGGARPAMPATRPSPAASSWRSSSYSALRPPPLPPRPATGLRNRRVLRERVPPEQRGVSVRAGRPQAERNSAAERAYRGTIGHHAGASPEPSLRAAEHIYATLEPPEPYETSVPTSLSGLDQFSRYLVNMIEQGRIPRELKGDLETALVYANRLDGELGRLTELAAKSETNAGLSPAERDELHSIAAANTSELARMQGLLDGASNHTAATDETRGLVLGLKARLAQGQARLGELSSRHGEGRTGQGPATASSALAGFVTAAARARRADAHVVMTAEGTDAAIRTGRFARWRGERQSAGNRATAERFLAALRSAYGDEVAETAAATDGVQRALKSGRALQAQHVNEAVYRANRLSAQYREANERLVATYVRPDGANGPSLTRIKIDDEARRIQRGHGPKGVAPLVDASVIEDKVSEAIRQKGDGGQHLVTTDDARRILDTVVRGELMTAYEAARTDAMARLSLDDPDSMARRSLAATASAQGLPLDPERLEPGAASALTRRVDEAVRSLDATSLGNDATLQGIADEVAAEFVAERARARAAVLESDLEGAARERIADQVVHDGTPADLVTHMAAACVAGEADIRRLGDRLDAPGTETVLVNLHDRMMKAIADSGVEIGPENQNHVYGQFWRLLLAPGGRPGLEAIADRFEPGASLREFTEGLGWIKRRFPMSAEGSRATAYNERGELEIGGKPIADVSEYLALMENLSNVLSEAVGRPGEIEDPDGLESLSQETLGLLRRIDAPLPRRWADPEVPP